MTMQTDAMPNPPVPESVGSVLAAYAVNPVQVRPLDAGLINRTWRVTDHAGREYALQAVNRMFPPEVNSDIDVVTRHLEKSGLTAPRLLPTRRGEIVHSHDGQLWRLFNYIKGRTHLQLQQPRLAGAAGAMLGRVHAALAQLDYELQAVRSNPHDTARHARHLQDTLENGGGHARYAVIRPLGEAILARLEKLPALPDAPARLVHGDPKISNFIFAEDDQEALCMVDFDTLNRMPVYLDLGDALRCWCNPSGEDTADGYFSLAHCRMALDGYAGHAGDLLTREEWLVVPAATLTICLELAARFCADALNEDYFSWDPSRFESHSEHSEIRARGQLNLADSVREQYAELTRVLHQIV